MPEWREHYQYCIRTMITVLFNTFQYFLRVLGDLAGAQIPWVPVGVVCWCEVRSADESCRTCPVTFTRAQSLNSFDFAGRSRNLSPKIVIDRFLPATTLKWQSNWTSPCIMSRFGGISMRPWRSILWGPLWRAIWTSIFIYFPFFKILQVYDSLCTKHASKWSATGHWWLLRLLKR